jgi:hypothetical protein
VSAEALIGASLIVFLAFSVRDISGFGSATIAIPLLAHFIALKVTLLIVGGLSFLAITCRSAVVG